MRIASDQIFGKIDMERKKIKFILILIGFQFGLGECAFAQLHAETVSFSISKTIFFTDEKIWFKGSFKSDFGGEISKVFYAELLDQGHRSWVLGKFPTEEGKVFNYLELPSSLPSGNYLLRVFTRVSPYLDLYKGVAQQLVTVFNPNIPPPLGEAGWAKIPDDYFSEISPVKIEGTAFEQLSSFDILVTEQFLDQIETIKLGLFNPYLGYYSSQIPSSEVYESIEDMLLLPELFGHIIHGKLIASEIDTTKTYFLSAHGIHSALYTDRPDEMGNLFFDLGGFKHWDYILVQVENGSDLNAFEVQVPSPMTKFKSNFKIPELRISESDAKFLQELKLSSALEPYFTQVFQRDSMEVVVGFVADQTYMLDDYTRFETIETTIKEFIPNVFVRKRDKLKEFRLVNVEAGYLFEWNPLLLIDALPIFNSDVLANFNSKFFFKVEVLNRAFYLNDRKYDGVLNFISYQNNFGLFPIPDEILYQQYAGLNPYLKFEKPIYSPQLAEKTIPDFRSVLFWYQKGIDSLQKSFKVNTSQMTGKYLLEVEFKDQAGELKSWKKTIIVD